MIIIHTHSTNPRTVEFWKSKAKHLVGKYTGPDAVRDSLLRGLTQHNVPFQLNPHTHRGDVVIVLSGIAALREQIAHKQRGDTRMLIAGPNIVTTPNDADRILCNPAIDHILVPSTWVRDHYCSIAPELAQKILVWPAGVAEAQPSSRRSEAIVYCKDDRQLCAEAKQVIKASGLTPRVITYGTYSQKNYLKALQTAAALVYLSPSESQGLALQEAWIRDVPTFVHFTGVAHNDAFTWHDDMINAPYLHEEFGAFYTTTDELKELLAHTQDYHPRTRCQQTLSDYATTKQLLELTTLSV